MSITLATYTGIGTPSGYEVGFYLPSYTAGSASGRPHPVALDETEIHEFTLTWENNLTHQDHFYLINAFYIFCTTAHTFVDPLGDTYSVMRHPGQDRVTFKLVRGYNADNANFLWSATLQLIEAIA
jgi:hypothetical protein